eukprot:CAMPEP_0185838026 /NCGR_PEP_ID=MMETSP1353-20130828/12382_1 /TAXON_ID=1077150 /ORGANISM="Erythrolobus australicus, Strain CCMP3124" /LENGTH=169 /DNA_ID=CAMNT_0028537029 /DNA_START=510 /DNA_END=1019 /DNA_ORIENTATION=-
MEQIGQAVTDQADAARASRCCENQLQSQAPEAKINSAAARCSTIEKTRRSRRPFTAEEDDKLRKLVARDGARNWSAHAAKFEGRAAVQLRARWAHVLRFGTSHIPFTPEEDALILQAQRERGNCWAAISRLLYERSDNAVKNRFYQLSRASADRRTTRHSRSHNVGPTA